LVEQLTLNQSFALFLIAPLPADRRAICGSRPVGALTVKIGAALHNSQWTLITASRLSINGLPSYQKQKPNLSAKFREGTHESMRQIDFRFHL
jgi:hypothetical protein